MQFFSTLRCFPLILVFMYLKEMLAQLILVWRGHISFLNQILVEKKKKHSCLIRILPFIPSHRCLIILEWQASGACPCDELILFHLFFFLHCGFQSFSPDKLCLWQNCEADRKHRVRPNFLRLCLQKVKQKAHSAIEVLLVSSWTALVSSHHSPETSLPIIVLIKISLPSWD